MYDICIHSPTLEALTGALQPLGLADDNHGHTLIVHGQVEGLPGVYATLRCDHEHADLLIAAFLQDATPGLAVVNPPAGLPLIGGEWLGQPQTQSLEDAKQARCMEVDALREAKLRQGYTFTRGGATHVLQTRDDSDRTNWLGVLAGSQAMLMAGAGGEALSIRTQDNATLTIPASDLMQVLLGALAHQSAIYAAAWAHKDTLGQITEDSGGIQAVQGHDITIGWPE